MDISSKSKVYYGKNSDRDSAKKNSIKQDLIDNQAKISHSGNANVDVDVNLIIDTKSIAYALLCSSLAKKELTNDQFEFALNKLAELTSENKRSHINKETPWNKLLFR